MIGAGHHGREGHMSQGRDTTHLVKLMERKEQSPITLISLITPDTHVKGMTELHIVAQATSVVAREREDRLDREWKP